MLTVSAQNAASADADGAKLFKNHCGTCHSLDATAPKRVGPHLAGLLQRKAHVQKPDGYCGRRKKVLIRRFAPPSPASGRSETSRLSSLLPLAGEGG